MKLLKNLIKLIFTMEKFPILNKYELIDVMDNRIIGKSIVVGKLIKGSKVARIDSRVLEAIDFIDNNHGVIVNSLARSYDYNKSVGGLPNSLHVFSEQKPAAATDLTANDVISLYKFMLRYKEDLPFNDVIYYTQRGFIHAEIDPNKKEKSYYTVSKYK